MSYLKEILRKVEGETSFKKLTPFELDVSLSILKSRMIVHSKFKKHGGDRRSKKFLKFKEKMQYQRPTREKLKVSPEIKGLTFKQAITELRYSDRTMRNHVRVGTAIIERRIEDSFIEQYRKGEISHIDILRMIREKEKKQKESLKGKKCKDCSFARMSRCPHCLKQVLTCKNSGYFVLHSPDKKACLEFKE